MAKKKKYKIDEIVKALQEADGYVSKAAHILGCTPRTVYNYRDESPAIAEAWESIREKRHDFVENALHKRIQAGSDTAIIFYLKTQAKDRGYVERQEVTGANGEPVRVRFMDYGLGIDDNTKPD